MLKRRLKEPFGKAGLTVAILALVLALVGGAYAAGGFTKSQEKQVTKIAKKYAGKNGTNGTNGAAGEKGAPGAPGSPGSPGAPGTSVTSTGSGSSFGAGHCDGTTNGVGGSKFEVGASTTYACNGKNGQTGFTDTLPSGKTETGLWAAHLAEGEEQLVPISFAIPIAAELGEAEVHIAPEPTNCPGTAEAPTAEPGNLCLYIGFNIFGQVDVHKLFKATGGLEGGASTSGAILAVNGKVTGLEIPGTAYGTWAVTAE